MMDRTNDMILYGGETTYLVDFEDEEELKQIVKKCPHQLQEIMEGHSTKYSRAITLTSIRLTQDYLHQQQLR